jgi:hypothetical protein
VGQTKLVKKADVFLANVPIVSEGVPKLDDDTLLHARLNICGSKHVLDSNDPVGCAAELMEALGLDPISQESEFKKAPSLLTTKPFNSDSGNEEHRGHYKT